MCAEKVMKISEPDEDSHQEINTEEVPLWGPKIRKNAKEENMDPIEELRRKKELAKEHVPCICACKESILIEPTISRRMTYKFPEQSVCDDTKKVGPKPEYEYQPTEKFLRIQKQNKKDTAANFFCEWRRMHVDKPLAKRKVETELDVPSPEPSNAKVALKKTCPRPSLLYPDPQTDDALKEQQPKSGIVINATDKGEGFEDYDSFDLLYQKKSRPPWPSEAGGKRGKGKNRNSMGKMDKCTCEPSNPCAACISKKKKKKKKKEKTDEDVIEPAVEDENELTKFFRKKVSLMSMATSYNDKDLPPSDEPDYPPRIAKILQKFRRESDIKRFGTNRRKFKRGTLQSHSFTDICQPTLKDFFFGSKEGTMHQGDESFPERIRNKQGVCMPVAAYCYSIIKHPNKWTREIVDDILIYGNNLLIQSLDEAHIHNLKTIVNINVLRKYITIGDKKFRFHIGDPDIAGYMRSDDKTVYNITKALSIFFARHNSGIIKTKHLSIGIWKQKYLYLFDAKARTKDLYCCPTGAAIMAVFYDVQSLATVLLTRSSFGNWPFAIHPLKVYRVIPADDQEVDSETGLDIRSEYNILNEHKAVVLGSFDLGDKCFDFSRYKQSLTMSVVALVYSRLTPPSAWHRKTIDKILIIGNLLYRECICCTTSEEVKLENIPAIFTIGPYIVEIYIFANVYADVIYRSCVCQLQSCLELFFTKCTNAILQFGKCYLAVWKQRNMLYCFDPYSRDNEGYMTRDGCACVSMHSTLESLIETISHNFDKDAIFYVHALKVCKIHRDPVQTTAFPKHISMDEFPLDCFKNYKMKKSKKNATEKPVTVDYSAIAMRRLLAGESPHASIIEIGSHVDSLAMDQLNALMKKCPSRPCVAYHPIPIEDIADLDSPSLEDTQIEPPLPQQIDEAIEFMDLDSFGPTMDELEMGGDEEGEEYGEYEADVEGILMDDLMEGEGEGEEGWYYGKTGYSQFDMAGVKITEQMNTDITYFPIKRDILYPTDLTGKRAMKDRLEKPRLKDDDWENYLPPCPPTVTKSQVLLVETNFVDLPDDTQIILGSKNISEGDDDVEYLAPFVCIMAGVVANKYRILTWSTEVVDYVLKCGTELFHASKFRFDQVSKLEIPKITLGSDVFKVLVEYIFDSYTRQNILELALDKFLFVRSDTGVIVTPTYACAVMFRNHLYYLYDPFGNNELGLSEGVGKKGVAFFARFKDLHSLTARILFNKRKRETIEEVVYSRFVLSSVKVRGVYDYSAAAAEAKKADRGVCKSSAKPVTKKEEPEEEKEQEKPENIVGYRCVECDWMIVGTKKLPDRNVICENLKEDHFICICAIFMLLTIPVEKWSTRTVDLVYSYGRYVYSKATELYITDKSTIRNILIRKHFFDAIIKHLEITSRGANKDLYTGLDTVIARKFTYFLVQFPNICLAIHKSPDGLLHIFDPYGALDESPAGWLRCKNMKEMKKYLTQKIDCSCESYRFYTLDIIRIHKAPKSVRLSTELEMFTMKPKPPKKEKLGKPFHEDSDWLKMDPIMWSRKNQRAANGNIRGTIENMWHNWDEEYANDLWSLLGNINQRNKRFAETNRGNQTLANLVIAIGMTKIYELEEWNSAVVDSVLVNGDIYFTECTKDKKDPDYELALEDLKPEATIFPFSFEVNWSPVIEGIMFLVRPCQFNLYKALRSFFANFESRCGIIMLTKTAMKRQMAFGKLKDSEYFVFDCDCRGNPMFLENNDLAYILRMTTLNRLLHVLTLTLRGGEFFIYETIISDMKPMQ